jgi:hypothetical protein
MKRGSGIRRRGTSWIVSAVPRVVEDLATKHNVRLLRSAGSRSFVATRDRWLQIHLACFLESQADDRKPREVATLLRFRKRLHELVGFNPALAGEE